MSHALALGVKVVLVVLVGGDADGHLLFNSETMAGKAYNLARVVGEQPELAYAEVAQNLSTDAVISQIGCKAEFYVGIDRIKPLFLQLVEWWLLIS